ncbi:MAG: type VI secretion system Vgr family protein [Pseudomonadota bacterium]
MEISLPKHDVNLGLHMNRAARSIHDLIGGRQHHRILRMSFPHNNAPGSDLLVNQLAGVESVSRGFEFTLELLSDDRGLALKDMLGKLLSVELVRKDGSLRYFSGYCLSFGLKKIEDFAFYEARMAPWFDYLALRKNNCLFHNRTLIQQIGSIFSHYAPHAVWDWRQHGDDPEMTYACQFDETDSNYVQRRLEAAGWHHFYEHGAAEHKLILCDDSTYAEPIEGDPKVRLHRHGGAQEEDAIGEWSSVRHVTQGSVAVSAFDFKSPTPRLTSMPTLIRQGRVPDIETYEYVGAHGIKNLADGDRLTRLRMEEIEKGAKQYHGVSNNFRLVPGRYFKLDQAIARVRYGAGGNPSKNDFLILEVSHLVTNNYLQSEKAPEYSNRFTCIRKAVPWRPGRSFNSIDTKILVPQTATVVGPEGQGAIHVDPYGRIRVQFHWDREGRNNDCSSAWIRSAMAWAGNQSGLYATHRIDSEVLLVHIDGNPDRPFVLAGVHNANYMPPWALPAQRALTGLRSRELTATGGNGILGRSNFLVLDDTHQQIQAQLKSDHEHSQLSLGSITRLDGNAGRREARGQGWELYTQAWGVARAARGMLLTTESRPGAGSPIKDMGETVRRLRQARERHQALAEAALQSGAQEHSDQQVAVSAALEQQDCAIGGAGEEAFPELNAPHLVLASPAGIETSSAQSSHFASEAHTVLTAGQNLSLAAGDSLFASVRQAFRLFVHKAGMKLVAAAGKISIQAQSDDLDIIANKVLLLMSQSDWIQLTAKKGIRLQGGDQMLEISDLVQFMTTKPVRFHGNLETLPPQNVPPIAVAPVPEPLPQTLLYELSSHAADGRVHAGVAYTLYRGTAKVEEGMSDQSGRITIEHKDGVPDYRVVLSNGEQLVLRVSERLVGDSDAAHPEQSRANQGWRALDDGAGGREHQ